jgi:serine/threonine-protein kinase
MHELMTAELPFRGQGVGELLAAVLEQDPPPLSSKVEGVPEGVEKAVQKALRRQRDYRFASAAEFALELAPFASPRWAELAPRIEETLRGSPFVPTPSAVTALEAGGSGAHGASPETTTQHVDVEPLSVATPAFAMGPPPLPRPLPAAEGAAAVAEPGRGELAATAPRVLAWVRRSPARFAAAWAALMALGAVAVVLVRLLLGAPGAGAPVAAAATVAAMDGPSVTPAPSAEPGPADEAGEAPAAAAEVEGKPAPRAGGGRAPRPSGPAPAPARPKVLRSRD